MAHWVVVEWQLGVELAELLGELSTQVDHPLNHPGLLAGLSGELKLMKLMLFASVDVCLGCTLMQ